MAVIDRLRWGRRRWTVVLLTVLAVALALTWSRIVGLGCSDPRAAGCSRHAGRDASAQAAPRGTGTFGGRCRRSRWSRRCRHPRREDGGNAGTRADWPSNEDLFRLPIGTVMCNDHVHGGWLMFRHPGLRPTMDTRVELYTVQHITSYLRFIAAKLVPELHPRRRVHRQPAARHCRCCVGDAGFRGLAASSARRGICAAAVAARRLTGVGRASIPRPCGRAPVLVVLKYEGGETATGRCTADSPSGKETVLVRAGIEVMASTVGDADDHQIGFGSASRRKARRGTPPGSQERPSPGCWRARSTTKSSSHDAWWTTSYEGIGRPGPLSEVRRTW